MAEHGLLAQSVHRLARRSVATAGRLTSPWRMTPDFLIIGAQRCGTTTLYKTLVQHPGVLPAGLHKGVHYFDTGYERGFGWYRSHFPTTLSARAGARRLGRRPITGEASPYYMFHPLAPERIRHDLPEVRLIVMLRDPVERAHSAYTHERARGYETEDFETALALEPERLRGEEDRLRSEPGYVSLHHQHNAYMARGRYVNQLERLESVFGREALLVLDYDLLFSDITSHLPAVVDFLGLAAWLPKSVERRNARPRSALSEQVRTRLSRNFEVDDQRLEAWWGQTPSWRT